MKLRMYCVALLITWTGCALFHQEVSDEPVHDTGRQAGKPALHVAGAAGSGTHEAVPEAPASDDGMAVPTTGVWIGQLWSYSTPLCDSIRGDRSAAFASDSSDKTKRVVIVLEPGAEGRVSGRIQFGELEGQPPQYSPPHALLQGKGSVQGNPFWLCSIQLPTEGIEYTMLDVVRTAQSLSFSVSPNEYWDDWCQSAKFECRSSDNLLCAEYPTCVCADGECHADLRERLDLRLAFTESTLEGTFRAGGDAGDIRLRRVQ